MGKIIFEKVDFHYPEIYTPVFEKVSICIDTQWRLGLIGRNGRGKTTLLRLMGGELSPTAGRIKKDVAVEYFPYNYLGDAEETLDVIKECIGGLYSLEQHLDDADSLEAYMELDGFGMEGKIRKEAGKIGLRDCVLERKFDTLSSGERTKALIIAMFLRQNTFVLLDEPTNHLDAYGKEELKNYLRRKRGFILVSHDRAFLDCVADHILSVNKADITVEKGNYTTWENNKRMVEEYERRTSENLQREIARMEGGIAQKRDWAEVSNTQKYHFASNSRTNGVQAYFAQAKRSELRISKNIEEKKKLLRNYEKNRELRFEQEKKEGWLIKTEHLSFSYVETERLIQNLSLEIRERDAVWIQGRNGSGKSTLLKLITGEIAHPCVSYNGDIVFSVLPQEIDMGDCESGREFLEWELKDGREYGSAMQICGMFDITEELLEKPCDTYSSGEKKKIYLARVLSGRNHVIVLDEPLNYMDVMFRRQLVEAFRALRPTVLLIEHDDFFLRNLATVIVDLDTGGTERVLRSPL